MLEGVSTERMVRIRVQVGTSSTAVVQLVGLLDVDPLQLIDLGEEVDVQVHGFLEGFLGDAALAPLLGAAGAARGVMRQLASQHSACSCLPLEDGRAV